MDEARSPYAVDIVPREMAYPIQQRRAEPLRAGDVLVVVRKFVSVDKFQQCIDKSAQMTLMLEAPTN